MTELRFLPALTFALWKSLMREAVWPISETARDGTVAYYPHALLSYHYWAKAQGITAWRDRGFVFGDSGGFSVRTKGAVIDPIAVLRWQAAVCTVGCLLDVPTMDQYGRPYWEQGLSKSIAHTKNALPLYEQMRTADQPFRWWGVAHGNFGAQIESWWKAMESIYPFREEGEGWAFRPEPAINPITVAHMLQFARGKGVTRAHFLATTAIKSAATLAVLATELGFDLITFDSASAAMAAGNRQIMTQNADGLGWSLVKEKTKADTDEERWRCRRYMWEKCSCVPCTEMRAAFHTIEEVTAIRWVCYMYLHNLLVQVHTFERFGEAARKDGRAFLRSVLGHREYHDVLKALVGRVGIPVSTGAPRSLLDYVK